MLMVPAPHAIAHVWAFTLTAFVVLPIVVVAIGSAKPETKRMATALLLVFLVASVAISASEIYKPQICEPMPPFGTFEWWLCIL